MEHLTFEKRGNTGILTVNRPKALNALNRAVLEEMDTFLSETVDAEDLRALILTGAGDKAFIAGADIAEMKPMTHLDMMAFCDLGQRVTVLLETIDMVTIAAVNGYALGGGLEMALACDFIYASENARLGVPEVSLGLIPGFGGTQRLTRAVGMRRAKELTFTGRMILAQEALTMGLVNQVVSPTQLIAACLQVAEAAEKNAPVAVTQAKRAINMGASLAMADALELEKQCCVAAFATEDRLEGMTAFLEKRKAAFRGR